MNINGTVAVVTGANRGIGRAFVEVLLGQGAKRVYATARDATKLADLVELGAGRVIPVTLDTTDPESVSAASKLATDATLLINNAGALHAGSQITASLDDIRADFETNYFGTLRVIRAFVPVLEANGGGAVANILSVVSLVSMPALGGYSASKAALHSLTLALRGELKTKGITVHGIYPGPVDTEMARGVDLPKATPTDVATSALAGVESGESYILPDPMARQVYASWSADHAAVEAQFGSM